MHRGAGYCPCGDFGSNEMVNLPFYHGNSPGPDQAQDTAGAAEQATCLPVADLENMIHGDLGHRDHADPAGRDRRNPEPVGPESTEDRDCDEILLSIVDDRALLEIAGEIELIWDACVVRRIQHSLDQIGAELAVVARRHKVLVDQRTDPVSSPLVAQELHGPISGEERTENALLLLVGSRMEHDAVKRM